MNACLKFTKGLSTANRPLLIQSPNISRCNSSSWSSAGVDHSSSLSSVPFYGTPRRAASSERTLQDRVAIALHHATTAFADPTRADAVAALGEITGPATLQRIHDKMMEDPTGRLILKERPIVSKSTIPYERLIAQAPDVVDDADSTITFGQAYGSFLKSHGFDPDERDEVKFVEDDTLAYIMLRYRQCHDFWHALTGLPPTVLGELGIKWLELFQTGMPVAALSCTVGSLRLDSREREILLGSYLSWAIRASQDSRCFLMNMYYEKEFDTPLDELRRRLNLEPAPAMKP